MGGKVALLALALGGTLALTARAQSPLGDTTWDCLISGGGQKGLAILTFSSQPNGTSTSFGLSGYELIASMPKNLNGGADGRNLGGNLGRYYDTNAPTAQTNVFGFTDVQGSWSYDDSGHVIGYLWFLVQDPSSPSSVTTNAVSFKGKVVPGKRLTLSCSTSYGKVVYRGRPYVALTDLTGSTWYGVNKQNKQFYQEFFSLSPGPMANIYQVSGYGPGYTYGEGSYCFVSEQHKIGFSFIQTADSTNGVLRATMGNLVSNKKKTYSNTKGTAEPDITSKFKATLQFLPPPQ